MVDGTSPEEAPRRILDVERRPWKCWKRESTIDYSYTQVVEQRIKLHRTPILDNKNKDTMLRYTGWKSKEQSFQSVFHAAMLLIYIRFEI